MSTKQTVLHMDLETAPLFAAVWGAHDQYVRPEALEHDTFMLSWAALWDHQKQVKSQVLTSSQAREQDDSAIVPGIAELVRQADKVVAHNASRFDMKVLNSRLLQLQEEPLGPVDVIDTLTLARRSFRLASNSLDYIAHLLGLQTKQKHEGLELWRKCYVGDAAALKKMVSYNRQDVRVLKDVFHALRPYVKGLGRMVDADYEGERVCSHCGEETLQRRGFYRTNASTFRQYHCQNGSCRKWDRGRKPISEKKLSTVPITTR